jgi:HEAT repeat protein
MIDESYKQLQERIDGLVANLSNADGLERQRARLELIDIGWEAVPALREVVNSKTGIARWEAIEALGRIKDPSVAQEIVGALRDDSMDVRWAAANALIELDRAAIKPLLEALTRYFDSQAFREVAYHILHTLKTQKRLLPSEVKVFEALKGASPSVEVPWAAQAALEDQSNT